MRDIIIKKTVVTPKLYVNAIKLQVLVKLQNKNAGGIQITIQSAPFVKKTKPCLEENKNCIVFHSRF